MSSPARNPLHSADSGNEAAAYIDSGVGIPDRLERIWAPYRMNYIREDARGIDDASHPATEKKDPFLEVPKMSDEDGLIVARGEFVYCVLNLYPYNAGHMMVVPFRKEKDLEHLTAEESTELMCFVQHSIKTLKAASRPDAVNVGLNLGKAAGGSVGDHLHVHVVPRWSGDSNFMTVIDGTKVLPQTLRETRALLAGVWGELDHSPGLSNRALSTGSGAGTVNEPEVC